MSKLLATLPGVPMPIPQIEQELADMWQNEPETDAGAPSSFRASQMNVILHFGLEVGVEDAQDRFDEAIRFAQRYPCRIIVLCPDTSHDQKARLEGKLYSQCFIGTTYREMCCCEALLIGYEPDETSFLENQVSVWLENDLPTCHWFHGVPARRVREKYLPFLQMTRRVLVDSSREDDGFSQIPWPRENMLVDLAKARTLPMRQSLGQFLSSYAPGDLVEGLSEVSLRYAEGWSGEAKHLLQWIESCLGNCHREAGTGKPAFELSLEPMETIEADTLRLRWRYGRSQRFFDWVFRQSAQTAYLKANFGDRTLRLPHRITPLPTEVVLSEAIFFG